MRKRFYAISGAGALALFIKVDGADFLPDDEVVRCALIYAIDDRVT